MAKALQCDRCKTFTSTHQGGNGATWAYIHTGETFSIGADPKHLCAGCSRDFERFMDGVALNG